MSDDDEKELVRIHVTLDGKAAGGETLWARPLEDEPGLFEVRNVPYFTYGIHVHDVVRCEVQHGTVTHPQTGKEVEYQMLEVVEVARAGGWHTVRVLFADGTDMDAMRKVVDRLGELGGHPDLGFPGFLSLGVPPDQDFEAVLEYLDEMAATEMLQFETAEQKVEGSFCGSPAEETV